MLWLTVLQQWWGNIKQTYYNSYDYTIAVEIIGKVKLIRPISTNSGELEPHIPHLASWTVTGVMFHLLTLKECIQCTLCTLLYIMNSM